MKTLNRWALGALALLLCGALGPTLAEDKNIVICGTTWGKYGGEDLPGKGFVPDLVTRVFTHAGYQVETALVPWARCVQLAKQVEYDLVSSGWRGDNFAPDFDYLNVILVDTINLVTRENSGIESGDLENLAGKRVGYVRDAGGLDAMIDPDKMEVVKTAELDRLLYMLDGGRIDAIVSDPVNLNEAVKALERPLENPLVVLQPPLQINYNSPLISKNHPDKERIIADFDRSYHELVADGLYGELIDLHDLQVQPPE